MTITLATGERRKGQTPVYVVEGITFHTRAILPEDGGGTFGSPDERSPDSANERRVAHERRKQANRAIEMALKDGDTYLIQVVSGGVLALRRSRVTDETVEAAVAFANAWYVYRLRPPFKPDDVPQDKWLNECSAEHKNYREAEDRWVLAAAEKAKGVL